jgi:hypothetical protein
LWSDLDVSKMVIGTEEILGKLAQITDGRVAIVALGLDGLREDVEALQDEIKAIQATVCVVADGLMSEELEARLAVAKATRADG